MPKILEFDEHARRSLERGVDALANAVKAAPDDTTLEQFEARLRDRSADLDVSNTRNHAHARETGLTGPRPQPRFFGDF